MNSNLVQYFAPRALLAAVAIVGGLFSPLSQAQQVYRIVGADGKVTFSDRPPSPASNANVSATSANATGPAAAAGLPFELRQLATKYPVILYTSDNCGPCNSARSLLTSRGIPFSEKTVTSAEDSQALQRISGETSLPFMTIGSQQLKGFSDSEWTQYLNAAGYPASSVLPASYRAPAATPLVTMAAAATAAPGNGAATGAAGKAAPVRPAAQPNNNPGNPAGIRF